MALSLDEARRHCEEIVDEVSKAIVGKREVLELVLIGILVQGHILLEDLPGLAKTLMARSFAQVLGVDFNRIQFTPDLLPADITGSSIYDQRGGHFEFRPGPLFTNLLLGDEINRAPPKTQAALLEAMQEDQITVENTTYPLAPPFVLIATQNPIEYEGTYPLPEAQLDRFMLRTPIGYPTPSEEWEILQRRLERRGDDVKLEEIVDRDRLLEMQAAVEQVHVSEPIGNYIVAIVEASRDHGDVQVGASPRGALAVMKLARGRALLAGRDFVTPDDVKSVAVPALAHRLTLRPELWVRRVGGDDVVRALLAQVPAPSAD
ncbi:MAG: AAA family ATPase [Actinomycetota bacterium]